MGFYRGMHRVFLSRENGKENGNYCVGWCGASF